MGQEFQRIFRMETWKLLSVFGMMFVMIITFQHFELPSRNILLPMSSDQIAGNESSLTNHALSKSGTVLIVAGTSGLNSSNGNEKDQEVNSDHVADENVALTNPFGSDDPDMESLLQQIAQPPVQFVLHPDNNESTTLAPSENINRTLEKNTADVNTTLDMVDDSDDSFEQEEAEEKFLEENSSFSNENVVISPASNASPVLALHPMVSSSPNITVPKDLEFETVKPVADVDPNSSSMDRNEKPILDVTEKSWELQNKTTEVSDYSPALKNVSRVKKMPQMPKSGVISVSEMNSLLLQSWSSPNFKKPQWRSAVDDELLHSKFQIMSAPVVKGDPVLYAPLYWNISMFKRSYDLMENLLKIYIYKEGAKPILHQPVLKGIYASEGWFMKQLEGNKKFVTKNPKNAHLFYLPFSSRNLEMELYVPGSHSHKNLIGYLKNYLDIIVSKYPFWNRTRGADHFLVACHDWAPSETRRYMYNCIRALCNADVKEGFAFGKDVSLPETNVRTPQNPIRDLGGKPASQRPTLAFYAGSMHGYVRPILLKHWGNNIDPDMKIYGKMPKKTRGKMNYPQHMKSSKYCICPRGYEVNSPRIVEAIMYECVPVIISDNYVPPFYEVLNWESFAVFVLEKDIPNLKNILLSIPERRFREMQMRVKKVQQHFLWHSRPVKYDLFHMILHSIWYNRVFQMQT